MSDTTIGHFTDQQLLTQIAIDDSAAFKELMTRYVPRIYPFILNLVKASVIAEEITQDIFIKIWENRRELSEINYFSTWTFTIGRNLALNVLKQDAARFLREAHYVRSQENHSDSESDIYLKDYEGLLNTIVNQLPPKRREILKLKMEKGWSHEEIGQHLGISPNTVKNQLAKSYSSVRKELAGYLSALLIYLISQ